MSNKQLILVIMILILLISCTQQYTKIESKATSPLPRNKINHETQSIKEETIIDFDLRTEDNLNIKATFYKGNKEMPSIILLHMLSKSRTDWNEFAVELQKLGYNVVAIDLRGHGQSDLNWRSFSDSDFNKMVFDVKAAKEYLTNGGVGDKIAVIGASIGANIGLNFAAQDSSIKTIVLLSPGLDYRGVKTEQAIKQFTNPVLIVASEFDSYAADSSRALKSLSQNSTLKIYDGSLHGTNLFGKTDVDKVIADWLNKNLK